MKTALATVLWRHRASAICVLLSAVAFILCGLAAVDFRVHLRLQFQRESRNIAHLLISHFDYVVRDLDDLLLGIVDEYPTIDPGGPDKAKRLYDLLKRWVPQPRPELAAVSIADKNGFVVATTYKFPFEPMDASSELAFRVHADRPDVSELDIGAPIVSRISNEWVVRFTRPLRTKDGAFDGVVSAAYRISEFTRLFEKLDVRTLGVVALTGRDGILRMRSLGGKVSFGDSVATNRFIPKRILAGEREGVYEAASGVDGIWRIGYFVASSTAPFHIYVGYEYSHLDAEFYRFSGLLAVSWAMFTGIMVGALLFVQRMQTLRQMASIQAIRAAAAERQRLVADMHDSIGASLAVLISHVKATTPEWTDVKRRASQILTELRFLVDTVATENVDLNLLLANVRHRMRSGIELAGIEFVWKVDDLPDLGPVSSKDALALRLLLMEALSNVMHHARARIVTLSASYDYACHRITIAVIDDGCGFDVAAVADGHGLRNMRARAKSMSLPTTLDIDSAPNMGTSVRITIELQGKSQLSAEVGQAARLLME